MHSFDVIKRTVEEAKARAESKVKGEGSRARGKTGDTEENDGDGLPRNCCVACYAVRRPRSDMNREGIHGGARRGRPRRLLAAALVLVALISHSAWRIQSNLFLGGIGRRNPGSSAAGGGGPWDEWGPDAYLRLALSGPRRCHGAPCYVVDVIADPYQPRLFLSALGLPASDIDHGQRGSVLHIDMVDVRSGDEVVLKQPFAVENKTHGFALFLRGEGGRTHLARCINLRHQWSTAMTAFYESQTFACDLPSRMDLDEFGGGAPTAVDVLLAPKNARGGGDGGGPAANLTDQPFYVSDRGCLSKGLFNSASRISPPITFSWRGRAPHPWPLGTIPTVSACLIGVNYNSAQHLEVIQSYITMGFAHVYLGLPQWPTSDHFHRTWGALGGFVRDGLLSIIVSEYTLSYIQPTRFGRNFTYAPQGHKTSFLNTCLLAARAAGDDVTFVGDMDELVEHSYGNSTAVGEVVADQLSRRNLTMERMCSINMGSVDGIYRRDTAGHAAAGRIADKLAGAKDGTDSVEKYGKSFHNVRRVLRAGLHGPAYCEDLPRGAGGGPENRTRPSALSDKKAGPGGNLFRASRLSLRTLHLKDSYRLRSEMWEYLVATLEYPVSYYVRDWSDMVHAQLRRRLN